MADALNWAGVNEEAFQAQLDACNTEAEREALIRQTLNGLYSEASANYETNAADLLALNEAQARQTAAMAKIGEAITPVKTALAEFVAIVAEQVAPILQELVAEHGATLTAFLSELAVKIGEVIAWIVDNWEMISTIAAIIAGVGAAIIAINTAITAFNAVMAIANLLMSPVTLIILAIVAAIALCIIYWDEIKAVAVACWEAIVNAWNAAGEWFGSIIEKVKGVFANIDTYMSEKFGSAWTAVKKAFQPFIDYFKQKWETVKGIFSAVKSVLKGDFQGAWEAIKGVFAGWGAFFQGIWNTVVSIFTNVGSAIGGAIKGVVSTAINAVLSTAVNIINGFISAINFAISVINAIPGVSIGTITPLSVPAMAKGGVVDGATLAQIGEDGAEAVVPLENNLEWLDKLAGMLNDRMGGNQPIVINVDGKRFGEIAVDTINGLTRQRGSIPLVIA